MDTNSSTYNTHLPGMDTTLSSGRSTHQLVWIAGIHSQLSMLLLPPSHAILLQHAARRPLVQCADSRAVVLPSSLALFCMQYWT